MLTGERLSAEGLPGPRSARTQDGQTLKTRFAASPRPRLSSRGFSTRQFGSTTGVGYMGAANLGWLGWVATGMSVGSYFCRNQVTLRRVQAVAALVWISYGIAISAGPIIAANVVIASVAAWSTLRGPGQPGQPAAGPG